MALDIGELVGKLSIDDKGMDKGLKEGESKFKKFGDKLSGLALAGGLAAGAALVAGLVGALDQGAIGAKIAAQMGGTAEDAKTYGKTAGKLYAQGWGDSVETIGETIKTVAKAHILEDGTPQELEDAARSAQILADVFGQDVDGSVRAVQQLIRNGLVPDAKSGFDLIAAGIQNGVDKSDDLLDTLNEYPTEFRELGLTGKQAMGLLSQGLKAGARDGDTVADALKEFAIRSKDASTTSAAGFKLIGLNGAEMTKVFAKGGPEAAAALDNVLDRLRAMKDPVAQNAAAVDLFGTKAEDLGNSLFALDLTTAEKGFENTAGSIDRANKAVSETPAAKLETFKRTVEQTATSIAADMIPSLISMGGWLKDNKGWVVPLGEALGILAAGIIAVNLATKAWAATEAAFTAVKGAATSVQWLWNASLLAFPGTWIVLGILAIIAVIVLIATKTTWFQDAWNWAWGGIKSAAQAVWGWISGTLWPGITGFFSAIGHYSQDAYNAVVNYFGRVASFLLGIKNTIGNYFAAVGDFIASGFARGESAARGSVNAIIGFVNRALGSINSIIGAANKIPGVNLPSIGTIPKLATGGSVSPRAGGTPVIMGDGGQVEHGIPDDAFKRYVQEAVSAGGGGGGMMRVELGLDSDGVIKVLRSYVERRAGGSVQVALGGR